MVEKKVGAVLGTASQDARVRRSAPVFGFCFRKTKQYDFDIGAAANIEVGTEVGGAVRTDDLTDGKKGNSGVQAEIELDRSVEADERRNGVDRIYRTLLGSALFLSRRNRRSPNRGSRRRNRFVAGRGRGHRTTGSGYSQSTGRTPREVANPCLIYSARTRAFPVS